ncbi:hypothetical protein Hanom_Chr08g00735261 [Helianthus anomalus]
MTKENWHKAIRHFLMPEHIKRSLANAACRGKQRYANRGGSSSYASTSFKEVMLYISVCIYISILYLKAYSKGRNGHLPLYKHFKHFVQTF